MKQEQKPSGGYRYNRISFFLNGRFRSLEIAPGISTLDLITKQLHLYGTKCSCNEGDCGACTVVIAQPREGSIVYEAITSCLYPAAKLHGKHLITVEGLGSPQLLHPIQKALLEHHGTQCGYCTPGFVMSLFACLASISHPDHESILAALEGNLCRCTGYQSILDAAAELSRTQDPGTIVPQWCRDIEPKLFAFDQLPQEVHRPSASHFQISRYLLPKDLDQLKEMLAEYPRAFLIAGGTDIMVQVNVQRKRFGTLIDLSNLPELNQIKLSRAGIHIGAAVSYTQIMDSGIVRCDLPELVRLCRLIASKQIRNFGTLAGNIGNASPIGDSLPLLLVYEARLLLSSQRGCRECALQDFFIGYRLTVLKEDEFIREIIIPIPPRSAFIKSLKTAKRRAVDISSVVSAIRIEEDGRATLTFGGVAAQPVFSEFFAQSFSPTADWSALAELVAREFTPLSDVRGSADYRRQMIINHILRYREAYHG
ncbi:MAG: FAD binding domain-containing protein [Candidatus Cloacimonadaceae bacterium]|jgi:xanthine dehydrogenase small subunit|nr:FAD binding domain-containing protein [Candidatus Cloacimonadota bacterium]MCK9179010.1 FAD binding domain-containing protein [Candidatus Cloacimonadota bacterium]MDY0128421.1 FAD binding domain-containing protein [Candidatus Cloacimonadaceae bacterium]